MRERSTSTSTPAQSTKFHIDYVGTYADPTAESAPTSSDYHWNSLSTTRVMHDVVTPNYHKLIANGTIINNPMDQTTTIETIEVGSYYRKHRGYSITGNPPKQVYWGSKDWGSVPASRWLSGSYLPPPVLDPQRVIDIANTNAWAKADVSEAQVLATLAEGRETIASLRSILYRVIRIVRALKRFDLKVLSKEFSFKELQNRYMEARYALRPLIYDTLQILAAVTDAKKKGDRLTARGFATDSGSAVRSGYTCYSDSYSQVWSHQQSVRSITARSGVLSKIVQLNRLSVWGANQLLETAWELVPFSFIVDWFFNVGKHVAAWTPSGNLCCLASWVVVEDTTVQTTTLDNAICKNTPGWNYTDSVMEVAGSMTKTTIVRRRIVNTQLPIWPTYSVRLDMAKLLDLTIILKGLMSR